MTYESKIEICRVYPFHGAILVGLSVESKHKFPLVVGCSLRTTTGTIIDLPARRLKSPGLALWHIDAPAECSLGEQPRHYPGLGWQGQVIFALWTDSNFRERLADTGWVHWHAPWLIGHSTAGLQAVEEEIDSIYGERQDVWAPLA
jgi:hypothetical protein